MALALEFETVSVVRPAWTHLSDSPNHFCGNVSITREPNRFALYEAVPWRNRRKRTLRGYYKSLSAAKNAAWRMFKKQLGDPPATVANGR